MFLKNEKPCRSEITTHWGTMDQLFFHSPICITLLLDKNATMYNASISEWKWGIYYNEQIINEQIVQHMA